MRQKQWKNRVQTKSNQGFTLLELMIGLVIISLISGFLLWGSGNFSRTYRVRLAVRELVGLLNYSRGQALVTQKAYRVQVIPAGKSYTDLKPLNAGSTSIRGTLILLQGYRNSVSSAFAVYGGQRPPGSTEADFERKNFELERHYQDILIHRAKLKSTNINEIIELYFMPDGSIAHCKKQGVGAVCNPYESFRICVRADPAVQASGPSAVPRRIEVSFNGEIKVHTDLPTLCN